MVIIDRSVAFVPTAVNVDGAAGAYMIRQPGVVTTLVDLFEQTWALVRLGAANRFQAAVLAKEHGWI